MTEIVLFETIYWKIILFEDQAYLGRCVIVLKRHCDELSNLTLDEWSDFYEVVKKLEFALKKTFKATMFNWACLMNDAYKSKNPKPQVHWHFRPRYEHEVRFADETFIDKEFGHHYARSTDSPVSDEIFMKIISKVREGF